MKRILTFAILIASTFTAFSQSLGYNDLGILFSKDDNYGTARYEAMSGAFGALGGDISAFGINPAGSAVAKKSMASITLSNRNTEYLANYYGNTTNSQDDFFNISQAGGILSFDSAYNSEWNRFALSFNYRIKSDFNNFYSINGNSGEAFFTEHIEDQSINFQNPQEQFLNNSTKGESSVMSFGFSAVHQNKLYVGGALNFHNIELSQLTKLNEFNNDDNGNTLDAFNVQDSYFEGSGFSLSLGFIYKMNKNIRFGLAYETPTWYQEVYEDSNLTPFDSEDLIYKNYIGYFELSAPNINDNKILESDNPFTENLYRFKSPGRITASSAFIFGKQGLISIDYTYKDYTSIKYRENDEVFIKANQFFETQYRNTHSINIGTEWRFDKMSVRGGYHYEKNPNLLVELGGNTNIDNLKGFSLGLGYNFGNTKFDLAYRKSESIDYHTLYNLGDTTINNNTSRVSATLTFSL